MKLSDGFDARRLRPRGPGRWRCCLLGAFVALLAGIGLLLALAGGASLLGHPAFIAPINASGGAAIGLLLAGLLLLWAGLGLWRRCRRRRRQRYGNELSLSPRLLKKRG